MGGEPRGGPTLSVESQETRPQAYFRMDPGSEFQRLELDCIFDTDLDLAAWSSYFLKV